ncbi:ATP-dependent helicase HrpB [Nonomuraea sp. FMUSA5-5]|uniref:ATP-dependent helicase HrpB n=1 Tax=Nonomuraea composti TaxID=2720023 RepID=A0ABX1BK05_9ACTN|nr:ATP-dependent helicase HrpB [Nonomuraea sp. FMUSA5-5]NJP98051.1 ATP-dependent helicase HrpB [Nonomuraea sp. FMUSA5-5]
MPDPERATTPPPSNTATTAPRDAASRAEGLPIRHVLPELLGALERHGSAVLTAPPGTGKTTVVPLALAEAGLRVVVAEPRRLAVRAAARRMGVSYTIRGERQVGANPMVEVVTTGVLLQRLQRDQELAGVDAVMLDECHERHLDADTALAFLLDVRDTLRPDLRLLATSATADAQPWADLLGGPIVAATGASHPVEIVWAPPPRPVAPPHGLRVDPALLSHVASVVRRALAERDGDVLCFLPGVGEIAKVAGMLAGDVEHVLQVHGQAPAHVQDAVLSPGPGRRVVLATSVAESSLTVPGVRVVVDSGLAREPRTDHARGLGSLTTVRVSKASATQRAGRAGREAPGTVYRCWSAAEHDRLAEHARPEIALADLTGFALQAACWGTPDASGLALLDPPPPAALSAAQRTLEALGAITSPSPASDARAQVTGRGRRMAPAGVHPRLARALLDLGPEAAEVVALLSEQLPRDASDDLVEVWRAARRGGTGFAARWRQESARLRRTATEANRTAQAGTAQASTAPAGTTAEGRATSTSLTGDALAGMAVALAFPERVARRRGGGYLMASGTQAQLPDGSRLQTAEWLAIAVADRPTGSASARVRQAVVIDEATARAALEPTTEDEVTWRVPPGERRGDVSARRVERLGAIELSSTPLKDADVRDAILHGLRTEDVLTWTKQAKDLRDRLAFCHRAVGAPWPSMDDLVGLADQWLEPELSRARRRADVERIDVASALRRLIPWSERLDEVAPERIEVPTGSQVRLDYSGDQPVLAVKLQELFGWQETPRIAGVPVLVHLLSPAGRPLAVTADLASFWREGYRHVRAEMRGRYPKHPWPEDPLTAQPTRRTKRSTP